VTKALILDRKKTEKEGEKALREREEAENRERILKEAREITIVEDASKPAAKLSKISRLESLRGQRVKVHGWVHHLRHQGITS